MPHMRVFIRVRLSEAGRRADVTAGGNGAAEFDIEVFRATTAPDDWAAVVDQADLDRDEAVLDMRGGITRDGITVPIADFSWVPDVRQALVVYRDAVREWVRMRWEEDTRRANLGLRPGDFDFPMCRDVLLRVPVYEKTPGSRNWMASVRLAPNAPGGLDRAWMMRVRDGDDGYYRLRPLQIGDVVEFGADLLTDRSKRFKNRWYGYVVRRTDDMLVLHKTNTAEVAFREGAVYAASVAPPPVVPKPRRRRIGGHIEEERPTWEL